MKKKVLNFDVSIADGRGELDQIPEAWWNCSTSYTRARLEVSCQGDPLQSIAKKIYLDPDFTVAKMYGQFIEKLNKHKDV